MKIIETIKEFAGLKAGCCLTIGNFDGVHVGHQKILAAAREACHRRGSGKSPLVVAVFEPHPVSVLHPEKTPERLTPLILKEHLLADLGADFLFLLKPDRKLLSLSAEKFVRKIIVEHIRPSVVVEGDDFRFGAGRTGNVHTLTNLGADNGFEVIAVDSAAVKLSAGSPENPVRESRLNRDRLKSAASSNGVKISSTLIRNLLIEGRVADAAVALGRPYRFVGKVVSGKGKGKLLGFPTANLGKINQLVPEEAVYAATVAIGVNEKEVCKSGTSIPAAVSIGRAETFGKGNPLLIEANLLIENVGSLYGKWMALDFAEKIRSQRKFPSEKDLTAQIAKDRQKAKQLLPHPKI